MKKKKLSGCLIVLGLAILFYACKKENISIPVGGLLPTNYISINDSAFSPTTLTVANGSSITFLNSAHSPLTVISDDSVTFRSVLIPRDSSFFLKPDTATVNPVMIYIPYHCVEHPSARGTIILTQ